jgi:cell division protein FtsZ
VTVIAAGFDGGQPKRRDHESGFKRTQAQQSQEETRRAAQALAAEKGKDDGAHQEARPQPVGAGAQRQQSGSPAPAPAAPRETRPMQFDDDDLDIPDFLK